jgi:hypothetical protein
MSSFGRRQKETCRERLIMQKGNPTEDPSTHNNRFAKFFYHSGIRIGGASGASKHQSFRKKLTLEARVSFSSSSTACWAGVEEEDDEGEATAMTTAVEEFCRLQ